MSVLLLACIPHVAIVVFGIQVMQVRNQSGALNKILGATVGLGLVLAIVLYQRFGMIGVPIALVIVKLGAAVLLAAKIKSSVDWLPVIELVKVGVPGVLMIGGLTILSSQNLGTNLVVGAAVFVSALVALNRRELLLMWRALKGAPRQSG